MKVAHLSEPAEERVIFRDGLGVRERRDTGTGELVEWLHLDPAFASVEVPLRERVTRLVKFQHVKFSRILGLEPGRKDRGPILVSSHVPGTRLSDVLEMAGHGLVDFEPGAGLQILRDVLGALAVLHDSRNVSHGSLGPERVLLTATGRVVMVEHVLGHALDRLQRPRHQLWREWRVATPPAAGTVRFDMQTDFAQAGLLGLAVLLGRPVDEEEYPHRLRGLLPLVQDRLSRSTSAPIASDVVTVLERLAPVDSRRAFKSVRDAQQALERLFSGGGAAFGASPAPVKSVVAAVAAIAASEAPAASAIDAAQPAAAIVVAAPSGPSAAVQSPQKRAQAAPAESASSAEADIDIEALLALEAELEGGSSAASRPPAAHPAPASASPAPQTPVVVAPIAPAALPAEDTRALEALAQERVDLERQFAELVASVAPVAASEAVHLIPETPATSEPLVDARVLWSSMPAADEADTSNSSVAAVAPLLEEIAALPLPQATATADDGAPVPFADSSVFSRLDVGATADPLSIAAAEQSRATAAIEHMPADWWKEALPWRDERAPDVEVPETVADEPPAAEEHAAAGCIAEIAAPDEVRVALAEQIAEVSINLHEADVAGELPAVDLESSTASVALETTNVDEIVTFEEVAPAHAAEAQAEEEDAADTAVVEDALSVGEAVALEAMTVDALQDITTDVADESAFQVAFVATDVEIETFRDESVNARGAVDSDLDLQPAADSDHAASLAPDVDSVAFVVEEHDAQATADPVTATSVEESRVDDVIAVAFVPEADHAPAPEMVTSEGAVDAGAEATDADARPSDARTLATADALAVADENIGGNDAMAPVRAYRLFGDITPILLRQDDEPGPMQVDSAFGIQPVDDAPSFAAAALLSRDAGHDDARDWRTAFLGANRDADAPAVTAGGFFTGQTAAADPEPAADSLFEREPMAEPAAESMDTASVPVIDELEKDDPGVTDVVCMPADDVPDVPLVDAGPVVYASDAGGATPSDAPTSPDAAPAGVVETAPADERAPVQEPDSPEQPDSEAVPETGPETPPVDMPPRVEMPAIVPQSVPEIVIVDDGHDGNAWDNLPSESPEVTRNFGSPVPPNLATVPSVVNGEEDHHDSPVSDLGTSASASKKKRRRSRRRKGIAAVPTPAPAVGAARGTTGIPAVGVHAIAITAIESTPPAVVHVAAAASPIQEASGPAPIAASAMAISLTPSDRTASTSDDGARPEMAARQTSLLGREVPTWTPPGDFAALRPLDVPASATQSESTPPRTPAEPSSGEHQASAVPAATGHAGAASAVARASAVGEAPAPMPTSVPALSSFGAAEALRPFEPEIRAVGMPDLDELQPWSVRPNVTAVGEALGSATASTGRSAASSEPWASAPVVQPETARGTNWRRFIAASVLIALFQGVAFAAWWWVQPGARGTLVVQTAKSGVEVMIDGKVVGRTPFREEIAPGRHKLGLRQGTNLREMPVEISVGVVTTQALEWPSSAGGKGNLQLTSNPAGAEIVLGGKVRGMTPLLLENLPAGDQVLMLRGDAGSVTVRATVVADETTPLEVKIFAGWVLVDAPVEVNLLLNGREKIGSSMDGQILLPPGTHRLRAVNEALGIRQWLTVNVEPGAVERVTFAVPPGTLTLQEEAEVFMDGASVGTTPGSITIPPGTHGIVVRLADGTERRQALTVRAGQKVEF